MRNCVKRKKNMAERVVQTCCCCCAPTFHPYIVTCNIFVLYCSCWLVAFLENRQNCCHQMSDFMAKMHQIRFRLGIRPRPRWGSLQRSPRPRNWILGGLLLCQPVYCWLTARCASALEAWSRGRAKQMYWLTDWLTDLLTYLLTSLVL